jgi:hypothetical protein
LSVERAHLVIDQVELRRRARDKFAIADRMFFTRKGLEQATDEQIAAVKAARFPAGQPLADLCCGIGGDLIALARGVGVPPPIPTRSVSEGRGVGFQPAMETRSVSEGRGVGFQPAMETRSASEERGVGFPPAMETRSVSEERGAGFQPAILTRSVSEGFAPAIGIDLDPAIPLLAAANLSVHHCNRAELFPTDAASFPVDEVAAWHIDPDRRAAGSRTTKVEHYQPPLETLNCLLAANPDAAIKLAPAAAVPPHWRESAERCWLGSRGECRQQVAWFGSLAHHPGQHSATVVDAGGGPRTIVGQPDEPIPVADQLGRYLYEPHAAVLAAKLTGALYRETGLAAVSAGIAYLTSGGRESLPETDSTMAMISAGKDSRPLLAAFEVIDILPFDQKQLRAYCRQHRLGRLEVKKRGVDIEPERLRKQVIGDGDESATLIVAPIAGNVRAIVARRTK